MAKAIIRKFSIAKAMIRKFFIVKASVEDPDQNWIRIQELYESGYVFQVRIHTGKNWIN